MRRGAHSKAFMDGGLGFGVDLFPHSTGMLQEPLGCWWTWIPKQGGSPLDEV